MKRHVKQLLALTLAAAMLISGQAPVTAEAAAPTMEGHGLTGAWYKAKEGTDRNDITRFTFEEERYIGSVKTGNLNGENLRPVIADLTGSGDDSQFVLASFTGDLEVKEEEAYTFYMTGDDGFRLYIDGELVIDFWYQKWEQEQKSEAVTLTAGRHDIRVDYLQGWGGAWIKLEWESPSIAREVIPESALFQKKESYYKDAKNSLKAEIEKCQEVCETISGSQESIEALRKEVEEAIKVCDRDYSDIEDTEEIISLLNQAADGLRKVKTEVYLSTGVQESEYYTQFTNPLYQGQDPFITQKDGFYYLVSSSNDDSECKIYVSKSQTLTDQGEKKLVMDMAGKQRRIFAPELFFLNDEEGGHWYIYYCADVLEYERDYPEMAAKYKLGAEHHIACCLRSKTDDPMGEYEDLGPLYCGENGTILGANDITVVEYDGSLFAVWGPLGANQPMGPAIVEMDTPGSVTKDRSMLPVGGGEGPRALKNADGDLFITTSEGGYSTDGYRLTVLCFTGKSKSEILDADKWYAKRDVFTSTTNVSGPARASFVKSADGTEDWMVYHSRVYKEVDDNWWRQVNIKKFDWEEDGTPDFGTPASTNKKYDLPSGDPGQGDQYEAENAILEGGSAIQNVNDNYYGDGYVHVPNTRGAAVSFVVHAKEAGDYIAGLRYAYGVRKDGESTNRPSVQLPSRASMNIYVNGMYVDQVAMDKNSITWNEWFTGSKRLELKQGANLITYTVDQNCTGNVHLDMLTLHQADIPYTQAEIRPEAVSLEKDHAILYEGESVQILAEIAPKNAGNQELSYSSDNEETATVDALGRVTAVKAGKAVISVTAAGNKNAFAKFTVYVQEGRRITQDDLDKLTGEVKKAQDEAENARTELQKAQDETAKAKAELQKAQDETAKVKAELQKAQENAQKAADEAEKAKEEAQKAEDHADELQKKAEEAQVKAEAAEKALAEAQTKAEAAEQALAEAQAKAEAAEKALVEAQARAEAAEKAMLEAQTKAEAAEKELLEAKKEVEELRKAEGEKPVPVKNGDTYSDGKLNYKVTNTAAKTVSVTGTVSKTAKTVAIPKTVEIQGSSYKVTVIAKGAFQNNKKLVKAVIGANVKKIGAKAFWKDSSLKKIIVRSSVLKAAGKNALKGIAKKAVIQVPSKKWKAYGKLLKKAGAAKNVTIK